MPKELLVMCASRSRPRQLKRMIESVMRTGPRADVAVYVDEDQAEIYHGVESMASLMVGKRIGQCKALNELQWAHPGYLAYGAATDDCEFTSLGWDEWVLRQRDLFPGKVGALAPRCVLDRRMDFPWFTDAWLKAAGAFCPLATQHEYWDVALELVAEQVAIAYAQLGEFDIAHHSEPPTDVTDNPHAIPLETAIWVLRNSQDGRWVCAWLAHNRRLMIQVLREAAGV